MAKNDWKAGRRALQDAQEGAEAASQVVSPDPEPEPVLEGPRRQVMCDQVRVVSDGYVGGSPAFVDFALGLRLGDVVEVAGPAHKQSAGFHRVERVDLTGEMEVKIVVSERLVPESAGGSILLAAV